MPAKDTFGSQPPLELIRQWVDYGFWYDRMKQTVKYVKVRDLGPKISTSNAINLRISKQTTIKFSYTFPCEKFVNSLLNKCLIRVRCGQDFNELKQL